VLCEAEQHLNQLDLEPGCDLDEVKKSYRSLSFIWHPDRQPERYSTLAKAKMQRLNAAHAYFCAQPEMLADDDVEKMVECQTKEDNASYRAHSSSCVRCHGSGLVAKEIGRVGQFEYEDCCVCKGSGKIVIDERNLCKDCTGAGLDPSLSSSDRERWIDGELQKRGWFDRHLNPLEYKRLWLRYHKEHLICSSCNGAGYFFYRPDERKGERRTSSAADFLRELGEGGEFRKKERRKA
jgi:hypothetical protein